jgi:hypothetical protein
VTSESNDYLPVVYRTRLVDVVNQIGGVTMVKIKVEISDKTGHKTQMLSPAETVEAIQQSSSPWVYADNTMIDPGQVDEANLSSVASVRIMSSGLVGGC